MAETIAETCAMRELALKRPLQVRPMAAFEGGYTAGVGSVVWQADDAEAWRRGWCALGVYCAAPAGTTSGEARSRGESGLAGPRGLYDAERATLFVAADGDAVPVATIAHETTHALQHQNYPRLGAIHLWHNRDLAAAANAALEGDAHVVGWAFDPARRLSICSRNNRQTAASDLARRWGWRPDGYWAHEGFPHVFGPALALERQLAEGNAGVNQLLRAPPLATRDLLAPEADAGVTFIDLSVAVDGGALRGRGCKAGLANTAGALGIWGLLLHHGAGGVSAETMPKFLREWLGDRFVHIACDSADTPGGELAWLTQWASDDAARQFTASYREVAAAATELGGVLASVPTASRRGAQVLVATAGLRAQETKLFAAPRETFHSYAEWTAADCFPQAHCETLPAAANAGASEGCDDAPPSSRLTDWIRRLGQARSAASAATAGEQKALGIKAGELAAFCVRNSVGNGDLALACRAIVAGIRHWRGWQADANWQLLPHCASKEELKGWLRDGYYADVPRPFAATESFAGIYGPPLVADTFAHGGIDALGELLANPPLSTRALLGLPPASVAFAQLPDAALAAADCTISATHVRGPFAIWTLLLDHGDQFAAETPPPLLPAWRGDRQFHLRCRKGGWPEGWVWATRWQSERAAKRFAAAYASLDPSVVETGLPHGPTTPLGRVVLAAPPALEDPAMQLARSLVWQEYGDWAQWIEAGCPPQKACRGAPPRL